MLIRVKTGSRKISLTLTVAIFNLELGPWTIFIGLIKILMKILEITTKHY